MKTLAIYDIPDDRIRTQVAERCKDAGLVRIQYSAFIGDLNHNQKEQLYLRLKRTLGKHKGNIRLYPICEKDLRLMLEIDVKGKYGDAEEQAG
jgi:CRISPR-associated protein Cas2